MGREQGGREGKFCFLPINILSQSFGDLGISTKDSGLWGDDFHVPQFAQKRIISNKS